ncbi:pentapeptide repeat-containing protein [Cellulomonas sp. NS3]|uniref:pentapeptide repeat-containing protein n=1 Tax=Cellulomonas sp. NS3 TaxID=2973977 RepID=UPI0021613BB7|nr:pentapeptide repeat-containing protein [Cellulomonas sp. NS3]
MSEHDTTTRNTTAEDGRQGPEGAPESGVGPRPSPSRRLRAALRRADRSRPEAPDDCPPAGVPYARAADPDAAAPMSRRTLVVVLVVGTVLTLAALVLLPQVLYPPLTAAELAAAEVTGKDRIAAETARLTVQSAARAPIAQALAAVIALSGAALAWRQFAAQRHDRTVDERAARFADAMERLRDEHLETRIGALHLLDRLADSATHRVVCARVLETVVRELCVVQRGDAVDLPLDAQTALTLLVSRPASAYGVELFRLGGLDLRRADLRGAHLEGAYLGYTHLDRAALDGARLDGADLTRTVLVDATLGCAVLDGARLDHTDLEKADLAGVRPRGVRFRDVRWPDGYTGATEAEDLGTPIHDEEDLPPAGSAPGLSGAAGFVGRDDLVHQVLREDDDARPLAELHGELGSGRTSVLRQIAATCRRPTYLVDLERYDPGHTGEATATSVGGAHASYALWVELLSDVARALLVDGDLSAIERAAAEAREHLLTEGEADLAASMKRLRRPVEPDEQVRAVGRAAEHVAARFAECWRRRAGGPDGPPLLLLDDVDKVLDEPIGTWLTELLHTLAATGGAGPTRLVAVLGLTAPPGAGAAPDRAVRRLGADRASPHVLSDLDEPAMRAFVRRFRAERSPDGRGASLDQLTAARLLALTRGHPATLRLVAEILWGPAAPEPGRLDAVLLGLPRPGPHQCALLVTELLERSGRKDLLRAVQAAAVPRVVTADLLRALLAPGGHRGGVPRLFDQLATLSFVDTVDGDGTVLRLQEHVRTSFLARLQASDQPRVASLSRAAAAYFRSRMESGAHGADGAGGSFAAQFRYEDPAWQAAAREWLYHSGALTEPAEQRRFVLEAAALFLDAFHWWGNYVHFDFCDKLVTDLHQLVTRREASDNPSSVAALVGRRAWPELAELHRALADIADLYPPWSTKSEKVDWLRIQEALQTLQEIRGGGEDAATERRVTATAQLFVARAWTYAPWTDRSFRLADAAYVRSSDIVADADHEHWVAPWLAYERAQLLFIAHDNARAAADPDATTALPPFSRVQELWGTAARTAQPDRPTGGASADPPDPDHELMSHLHRLRADMLRAQGQVHAAAWSYQRAVVHAYLYHNVGGPPDPYTRQLYVDVRARALRFLVKDVVRRSEQDLTREVLGLLTFPVEDTVAGVDDGPRCTRAVLAAAAGRPRSLAHLLWPQGPHAEDLGNPSGPCARAVRRARLRLVCEDRDLLHDLHVDPVTRGPQRV